MAAVQAAAVELLAEQGPREVTVRKVAARAGVNHALIHRHYGTKDALIRAVVTEQSRQLGERAAALPRADAATLLRLLQDHPAYWRVLARITLDDPSLLAGRQLPAATAALALVAGGADADEQTRVAAAVAASTALGWLVFGPHLARVLDLPDSERFDEQVGEAVRRSVGSGAARSASRPAGQSRVSPRRGGRADPAG
jgi:TetR/AcrR family transcriptional regulator, repressor for neighboring sulfatase